jgi:CHAT domain-containing protein
MQRWFAAGPSAMMNEPRSFYSECHNIYQAIFNTRTWEKDRHYVLIPDGVFNYLPFDALLTDAGYKNNFSQWPYLIKQVSLSQAYSLATWLTQQSMQYPSAAFTGFFVSKGKHTKQVILSIDEEYQALKGKLTGRYYSNSTATWNAFNNITDSTGILHISTHGFSAVADAAPYLQLYDKPFYLFDLRYKHFSPSLVVLSACKTADGLLLEGEGLNSISRGFTAAGAGGVISGLWNMNDKTAIVLMQQFYEQLPQQPNIALALHNAKKQWLQSDKENARLQLPYYWAGFVYSGHLQKLAAPVVQRNKRYYWLLALLIAPVGLYFVNRKRKNK